ncbi:MAG TPA: hypothetical protein VKG44_02030 [Candidatus Baltobacteraceae bacterium]|nr:hypothetical protein [Candidatus Baltobacteraceae bacterium]
MKWILLGLGCFFVLGILGAGLSHTGSLWTPFLYAALAIPCFAGYFYFAQKERREARDLDLLAKNGKRARGVLVDLTDTGASLNDNPQVKLHVRVEPPGEPPFTVVQTAVVSRLAIPLKGTPYLVVYDDNDRSKFFFGEAENGDTEDLIARATRAERGAGTVPPT